MLSAEPIAIASPIPRVSLWWCSLALATTEIASIERWLSEAEHTRMNRFGNDALRARYAAGRASLRWLLGRTLDIEPGRVPIVRGTRGRPRLATTDDIDFNVSHTADAALIAIAELTRIGVDIEREDRVINVDGIARKFLTPRERAALAPLDPDAARRRVLRLWTCKEASSKATGDALSAPFARIDIEIEPQLRLADGPPPYTPSDWSMHAVEAPSGFLGTIALWQTRNGSHDPAN